MSRRRPYLDLKSSILNLFRTPARWLKDITSKESIFEKPYLDQDYRAMHLNLPSPDWPSTPGGGIEGRGFFPDKPGTWTFKFDPGICTLGVLSLGCGESGSLGVSIGLLPPGDADKSISWSAKSSNPNLVRITSIDNGISGSINLQASEEETGTATICVSGTLQGGVVKSRTVPFLRGSGVLDYRETASLPALNQEYYKGHLYSCGCVDLEITCCDDTQMSWDDANSDDDIAQGGGSGCDSPQMGLVAITDLGNGTPYTWTISGTGFWLDSECTITSLISSSTFINIYADADACGAGTITVIGCDGNGVTGDVLCTTGNWVTIDICDNIANSPCPSWFCITVHVTGKLQYTQNWLFVPDWLDQPAWCYANWPDCLPCGCIGTYEEYGPGIGANCPEASGYTYMCKCIQITTKEWQC